MVTVYEYQFDFDTQQRYLLNGPVADGDKFVTHADYKALEDERDRLNRALAELVDKIDPGLDTGDLLSDAHTASMKLTAELAECRKDAECLRWITENAEVVTKGHGTFLEVKLDADGNLNWSIRDWISMSSEGCMHDTARRTQEKKA